MMDSAKYEMGKSVFSGKCQMSDNSKAMASQKSKLTALASKCGKDGTALPSLAGKLSAEQVDALDYYVSKRFGM